MKNKKLRHRNELNATLMAMSTPAKRIAYLAMIQLPYDEKRGVLTFDPERTFKISASDYAEICNVSTSHAYQQLKEGVRELKKTTVEIPKSYLGDDLDFKDDPDDLVVMFSLADYCAYSDGNGFVKLRWHRKMEPLIAELERRYTTQYLLSAVRLPIGNANNLYLLLRERVSAGQKRYFDIEFDELKLALMIESNGAYETYKVFNNNVFKNSAKQILEKTEFTKLEIEILERVKRRAHLLRVSYEYEDFKVSLKPQEQAIAEAKMAKDACGTLSRRAIEMMQEVKNLKK
jgi:plasmid replication initiation protein